MIRAGGLEPTGDGLDRIVVFHHHLLLQLSVNKTRLQGGALPVVKTRQGVHVGAAINRLPALLQFVQGTCQRHRQQQAPPGRQHPTNLFQDRVGITPLQGKTTEYQPLGGVAHRQLFRIRTERLIALIKPPTLCGFVQHGPRQVHRLPMNLRQHLLLGPGKRCRGASQVQRRIHWQPLRQPLHQRTAHRQLQNRMLVIAVRRPAEVVADRMFIQSGRSHLKRPVDIRDRSHKPLS